MARIAPVMECVIKAVHLPVHVHVALDGQVLRAINSHALWDAPIMENVLMVNVHAKTVGWDLDVKKEVAH
jgi:hypothetical protein